MRANDMKKIAEVTVETALKGGAETAEVTVVESEEFEVTVRKGSIETLTESNSSRIAISVSLDRRKASVTSSDLSEESIGQLINEAVELASVMDRDSYFGLPDPEDLGKVRGDLNIFDPETIEIPTDRKIGIAMDLERAACSIDERIISNGASFSNGATTIALANSLGFCGEYSQTFDSIGISCAAEDRSAKSKNKGKKQSSSWHSITTAFSELESIEEVASKAVSRTLRKLGAAKPRTCEAPVVFDNITARTFLVSIADAVNGGNIYRKSSFLADKSGTRIGSPSITVIDDPLLEGKLGTRPFDAEGVLSRKNIVIEMGILKSYLMSSYQARKLGTRTTGSAGGVSNFYMMPGELTPDEIIASIGDGLYLTSTFGPGANWGTGDFSQGGQGIWIENGKLSFPVNEFTIASTFQQMLEGMDMIGNDLEWKGPVAAPTFKINSMTISGT